MENKRQLFTREARTLEELFNIIERHKAIYDDILYRGQADSNWFITSKFFRDYSGRSDFEKHSSYVEIVEFSEKQRSDNIANQKYLEESFLLIDDFKNNLDLKDELKYSTYIGLAQHYGLPTNLIDFTSSSDIALYFAFDYPEGKTPEFVSLCITTPLVFENFIRNSITSMYAQFSDPKELEKLIADQIALNRGSYNMVVPRLDFSDYKINARIQAQSGWFIYFPHPYPYEMLMYRMECWQPKGSYGSQLIIKIPSKLKPEVVNYLSRKGIVKENIYPTDNVSEELKLTDQHIKSVVHRLGEEA